MPTYLVNGEFLSPDDEGFREALASVHSRHSRPLCPCQEVPVEMYVAHLGETFIVKRMPGTGSRHASHCPSYDPNTAHSARASATEPASERPAQAGVTHLKLAFALSRNESRGPRASGDGRVGADASAPRGLTLHGLLLYLWEEAKLNRWHPSFAGRRSWSTVRKRLLAAAIGKAVCGRPLLDHLFIPEAFRPDRRAEIAAQRHQEWLHKTVSPARRRSLMLLIGELKRIGPTRLGHVALIKHMPDRTFTMDETLCRDVTRRFGQEVMSPVMGITSHLITIGTFGLNEVGVPNIEELHVMRATAQWLLVPADVPPGVCCRSDVIWDSREPATNCERAARS